MAKSQRRYTEFVRQILSADEPHTPNPELLESLLHWLAGRDTQPAKAIQRAFNHHQASKDSAQRHTLNYLDRVLFAHDADPYRLFGLIPGCDFADIRARHKQLLQVFHPDRHQQHKDWFTRRSERLNHAYAHLKQNHGKPSTAQGTSASVVTTPTPKTQAYQPRTPNSQPRARSVPSATHLRARLKEHLGNAATLQQRAFIVLFTVPAVLLLVLYVNNQGNVEGGSVATVAKTDPTPQAPDTITAIAPRDPADLAGTPIPATDPEPQTGAGEQKAGPDAATTEPADPGLLRLASRSVDSPHNGGGTSDVPHNDDSAPATNEASSATQSEPGTDPLSADASAAPTTIDSQPTDEGAQQATVEESRADNTEMAFSQPQGQSERQSERQSQENAPARAEIATDDAEPLPDEPGSQTKEEIQTVEAEQTAAEGERADNTQTTNEIDSQTQESEENPENDPKVAQVITSTKETESDSNTNHQSSTTGHGPDTGIATAQTDTGTVDAQATAPKEPEGANHDDERESQQTTEPGAAASEADVAYSDTTDHESRITNHRDNAQAIDALLNAYAAAYKASNIDQFSALFQQNAETKYASGRREIKKKYGDFFRKTVERTVVFEDVRIQLLGNRQFKVTAQYQAAWTYPNGRSKTNAGRFQFHLTPDGDQLRIWRLNY